MKSFIFDNRREQKRLGNRTKNGQPRKGKRILSPRAYALRTVAWIPLRTRLRKHIKNKTGEQARIARVCGVSQSTIHRYLCNKCEHDQEPSYSLGCALLIYLEICNVAKIEAKIQKETI